MGELILSEEIITEICTSTGSQLIGGMMTYTISGQTLEMQQNSEITTEKNISTTEKKESSLELFEPPDELSQEEQDEEYIKWYTNHDHAS